MRLSWIFPRGPPARSSPAFYCDSLSIGVKAIAVKLIIQQIFYNTVLWNELRTDAPIRPRPLLWIGMIMAIAALFAALLYFVGVNLALLIGLSIFVFGVVFTLYGIQLLRTHPGRQSG